MHLDKKTPWLKTTVSPKCLQGCSTWAPNGLQGKCSRKGMYLILGLLTSANLAAGIYDVDTRPRCHQHNRTMAATAATVQCRRRTTQHRQSKQPLTAATDQTTTKGVHLRPGNKQLVPSMGLSMCTASLYILATLQQAVQMSEQWNAPCLYHSWASGAKAPARGDHACQ